MFVLASLTHSLGRSGLPCCWSGCSSTRSWLPRSARSGRGRPYWGRGNQPRPMQYRTPRYTRRSSSRDLLNGDDRRWRPRCADHGSCPRPPSPSFLLTGPDSRRILRAARRTSATRTAARSSPSYPSRCTHVGAVPGWASAHGCNEDPDRRDQPAAFPAGLDCPCHGSQFDDEGGQIPAGCRSATITWMSATPTATRSTRRATAQIRANLQPARRKNGVLGVMRASGTH